MCCSNMCYLLLVGGCKPKRTKTFNPACDQSTPEKLKHEQLISRNHIPPVKACAPYKRTRVTKTFNPACDQATPEKIKHEKRVSRKHIPPVKACAPYKRTRVKPGRPHKPQIPIPRIHLSVWRLLDCALPANKCLPKL